MKKIWFIILVGGILSYATNLFSQQIDQVQMKKLETAMGYIQLAYVDSVDTEKLTEDAIIAVLKQLDPHSVYISKKDVERMNEPLKGNFDGIGVRFNILHDTITVISSITGGPAQKLGIRAGDKIVEIEGEGVAGVGYTNQDVFDNLRGDRGSIVHISILRSGDTEYITYEITRDKIPIYSMDAAYMADPKTGYIKLNRFAAQSMDEVGQALDSLRGLGMENLILDLRQNGGGYLRTAIALADNFLTEGKLIVYTQGRSYPKETYNATDQGIFTKGKLVILIDEGSASASEILSGAIQDWDRGLIIGRRSFGKGLVQNAFTLNDKSVIRLTISRYYTPSGRSIQRDYSNGKEDYYDDINKRFSHGELMHMDSIHFPDSLRYKTLNLKRNVYGGGGIMPDIFIPLDTTETSSFFGQLVRKSILYTYALDYIDLHRSDLRKTYATFEDFDTNFIVPTEIITEMTKIAEEKGVTSNIEEIKRSTHLINLNFKALIATNLWTTTEFHRVINTNDSAFNKAIEVMYDETFNKLNFEN